MLEKEKYKKKNEMLTKQKYLKQMEMEKQKY